MPNADMRAKIAEGDGFIAALDQSGGSTPKALRLYGIDEGSWTSDGEMFDLIHGMRARIVKSPAFTGDRIVGAILFEMTMDREFDGRPSADYLWDRKRVVPFLKIDKGLGDAADGTRKMKDIPNLDRTLERAAKLGIFGTKMRSVIDAANAPGIAANVAQQFEIGRRILSHDLVPILEPEVTITIADKSEAEDLLKAEILKGLDAVPEGREIMLKLSPPSTPNHYAELVDHPKVLRVVALSGGHRRDEANALLSLNRGVIASFSRALTEGLSVNQSDEEFDAALDASVRSIHTASIAG